MAAALTALNAAGPNNSPAKPGGSTVGQTSPTLNVHGVLPNSGPVRVAVFSDAANFPNQQQAMSTVAIPSQGDSVQTALEVSPDGPYAVAVYQDLNDDGTLNRSSFGMPMEPYGFSQDAVGKLGPPSYEQAQVPPGTTSVDVTLQSPMKNLPF
jgi:uncharacterized protein (DUF2141 family)